MSRMIRVVVIATIAVVASYSSIIQVHATNIVASAEINGYISWSNINSSLFYIIESKPSLVSTNEWSEAGAHYINIKSEESTISVPAGVYYRIVGSEYPVPSVRLQHTGQTNNYYEGDDGYYNNGEKSLGIRFTTNNNGTVARDNLTGLEWLINTATGPGYMNWTSALAYCNNLVVTSIWYESITTNADWRLPNIKELSSICDYGQNNPSLPAEHPFVLCDGDYWSSTSVSAETNAAWVVHLYEDGVYGYDIKTVVYCVFPVRGDR